MGIEKFYTFLQAKGLISSELPNNVKFLWIDMNAVLHQVREYVTGNKDIKTTRAFVRQYKEVLFKKILSMIEKFPRLKFVMIAVDGVAPFAKTIEQRSRRYNSIEPSTPLTRKYSSIALTPGTIAMNEIHTIITEVIEEISLKKALTFHYSQQRERGEGEHKIVEEMKRMSSVDAKFKKGQHVVYGGDNDLVIIFSLLGIKNIFVWRNKLFSDDSISITSIDLFVEMIHKHLLMDTSKVNEPSSSTKGNEGFNKIYDFVLLVSLVGNDFVPQTPAINISNIDKIFDSYNTKTKNESKTIVTLTEVEREGTTLTIDWQLLRDIITDFTSETEAVIVATTQMNSKNWPYEACIGNKPFSTDVTSSTSDISSSQSSIFDFNIYKALWYKRALGTRLEVPEFKEETPLSTILSKYILSKDRLEGMINSYYESLEWSLLYYIFGGKYIHWDWYYPYSYAPLLSEIVLKVSDLWADVKSYPKTVISSRHASIIENMLYVIPPSAKTLVPPMFRSAYENTSPIRSSFPTSVLFDDNKTDVFKAEGKGSHGKCILMPPNVKNIHDFVLVVIMLRTKSKKSVAEKTLSGLVNGTLKKVKNYLEFTHSVRSNKNIQQKIPRGKRDKSLQELSSLSKPAKTEEVALRPKYAFSGRSRSSLGNIGSSMSNLYAPGGKELKPSTFSSSISITQRIPSLSKKLEEPSSMVVTSLTKQKILSSKTKEELEKGNNPTNVLEPPTPTKIEPIKKPSNKIVVFADDY